MPVRPYSQMKGVSVTDSMGVIGGEGNLWLYKTESEGSTTKTRVSFVDAETGEEVVLNSDQVDGSTLGTLGQVSRGHRPEKPKVTVLGGATDVQVNEPVIYQLNPGLPEGGSEFTDFGTYTGSNPVANIAWNTLAYSGPGSFFGYGGPEVNGPAVYRNDTGSAWFVGAQPSADEIWDLIYIESSGAYSNAGIALGGDASRGGGGTLDGRSWITTTSGNSYGVRNRLNSNITGFNKLVFANFVSRIILGGSTATDSGSTLVYSPTSNLLPNDTRATVPWYFHTWGLAVSESLNMIVATGKRNSTGLGAILYSADGATWTAATMPSGWSGADRLTAPLWVDAPYNKFLCFSVDTANATADLVLQSTDGITWTKVSTNLTASIQGWRSVYDTTNDIIYVTSPDNAYGNHVWSSADGGTTWLASPSTAVKNGNVKAWGIAYSPVLDEVIVGPASVNAGYKHTARRTTLGQSANPLDQTIYEGVRLAAGMNNQESTTGGANGVTQVGGDTPWIDPGGAINPDDTTDPTVIDVDSTDTPAYIEIFDIDVDIPTGAVIDGIEVIVDRTVVTGSIDTETARIVHCYEAPTYVCQTLLPGTSTPGSTSPGTDTSTFGGQDDLWSTPTTIDPDTIGSPDLKIQWTFTPGSDGTRVTLDDITVVVYYHIEVDETPAQTVIDLESRYGADLADAAMGAGAYVVVGKNNIIYYSTDAGTTWTQATSPVDCDYREVIYDGTYFYAFGSQGIVVRSADGISWTNTQSDPVDEFAGANLGRGNGIYVAGAKSRIYRKRPTDAEFTRTLRNTTLVAQKSTGDGASSPTLTASGAGAGTAAADGASSIAATMTGVAREADGVAAAALVAASVNPQGDGAASATLTVTGTGTTA